MALIIDFGVTYVIIIYVGWGSDVNDITNCHIITTFVCIRFHYIITATPIPIPYPIFHDCVIVTSWLKIILFDWLLYLLCWFGLCAFVDGELCSHLEIILLWLKSMLIDGVVV